MKPTEETIALLNRFLGWQAKIVPMDEKSRLYQGSIRGFQILTGTVSSDGVLDISFAWLVERHRFYHWEPSMLDSDDGAKPRLNMQFKIEDRISLCHDSDGSYTLVLQKERILIHFYPEHNLSWLGVEVVARLFKHQ